MDFQSHIVGYADTGRAVLGQPIGADHGGPAYGYRPAARPDTPPVAPYRGLCFFTTGPAGARSGSHVHAGACHLFIVWRVTVRADATGIQSIIGSYSSDSILSTTTITKKKTTTHK